MIVFRSLLQPRQKSAGVWKEAKWSIRDVASASTLLAQITALVDELEKLSSDIRVSKTEEELAAEAVQEVSESALIEIEESSRDHGTVISSAASIRLRSIEARTIDTAFSGGSTLVNTKTEMPSRRISDEHITNALKASQNREQSEDQHISFSILEAENRRACAKLVADVPMPPYNPKEMRSEELKSDFPGVCLSR